MWRCILTPQWRYERLELILSEYERNGYRVRKIVGRSLFCFEQSTPTDITYLITYTFMRDRGMRHWDQELLHNNGIEVATSYFTSEKYYRLPKREYEMQEFLQCRSRYLLNVFCQKILIGLIISSSGWLNLHTLHNVPILYYVVLIILVSAIAYIGWYIVGLIILLSSLQNKSKLRKTAKDSSAQQNE